MSDPAMRAAALLKDHRCSIDRLDAILVYTLAERFKHTQAVGRLKAEHDLPPSDPTREAQQIGRLERLDELSYRWPELEILRDHVEAVQLADEHRKRFPDDPQAQELHPVATPG